LSVLTEFSFPTRRFPHLEIGRNEASENCF
jgi:hypothetical protein